MKKLKLILSGVVLGLVIGLWFGVNIGKNKPIFSNPFAEENLPKKFKQKTGEAVEKAGKGLERIGEDIKGKIEP